MNPTIRASLLFRLAEIRRFLRHAKAISFSVPQPGTLVLGWETIDRHKCLLSRKTLVLGKRKRLRLKSVRRKLDFYTHDMAATLESECILFGEPFAPVHLNGKRLRNYLSKVKQDWCVMDILDNRCVRFRGAELKGVVTAKDSGAFAGVAVKYENFNFLCMALPVSGEATV